MKIEVYTDGSCRGNPGPGGWAFCIIKDNEIIKTCSESLQKSTNNICELLAICNALDFINENYSNEEIVLYSDSAYCVNGYNEWIYKWKENGFLTSKKEPVLNKELWVELSKYLNNKKIQVIKVKGHSTNYYNNLVDNLAQEASKNE